MDKTVDLGIPAAPGNLPDWSPLLDGERLLRLHPHWHIETIVKNGTNVRAQLKDHATEKPFSLSLDVRFPAEGEFLIRCTDGPADEIHFFPRDGKMHVRFLLSSDALSPQGEQDLTLWLQSIRQYLRLYLATTPYTLFFRALMNRALLKMNPSQRKICLMLYRFTVLEIVVILLILIGYFTLGR